MIFRRRRQRKRAQATAMSAIEGVTGVMGSIDPWSAMIIFDALGEILSSLDN